jgi:hypothetical protein
VTERSSGGTINKLFSPSLKLGEGITFKKHLKLPALSLGQQSTKIIGINLPKLETKWPI